VTLTSHYNLKICVVVVYRRPQLPMVTFLPLLDNYLSRIPHQTMPTVVLGDFNDDVSTVSSSQLLRMMSSKGFSQLVKVPTTDSGSSLDHIYYTGTTTNVFIDVVDTYYSDHDATYISVPATPPMDSSALSTSSVFPFTPLPLPEWSTPWSQLIAAINIQVHCWSVILSDFNDDLHRSSSCPQNVSHTLWKPPLLIQVLYSITSTATAPAPTSLLVSWMSTILIWCYCCFSTCVISLLFGPITRFPWRMCRLHDPFTG